jgi:hypothetical protein
MNEHNGERAKVGSSVCARGRSEAMTCCQRQLATARHQAGGKDRGGGAYRAGVPDR